MDNRSYYDDFSSWYERERGRGYHQLIDDLEVEAVRRYGQGTDVLEAGCGTGLILERTTEFTRSSTGLDLSAGMLARAEARGLKVVQGSITDLPFADESFDLVYSFKVLSHIEDIHLALHEMARVTRPGGIVLAEFYNTRSLRYLVKRLKPPTAVSESTKDTAVYTRYDSLDDIRSYLPVDLELETTRGIRIVTPVSHVHKVPGLAQVVRWAETRLADHPRARHYGGFLVAVLRKGD
ncbi:MAG: class I SAM-dependent methyltransferase [Deltaproteobacteria bacterium]|nr:class I SAM-dependent methyltransferase [Deltaproteobacteria bacterium]